MITSEDYMTIKTLKKRGVYNTDIAAELKVHPRTVSRALKRQSAPVRTGRSKESKLAPYTAQIDALLGQGVWNAMVILREIQAAGYSGGITTLRLYIQPKRPQRPSKATVRFETAPGHQLQTDWGELTRPIAGHPEKIYILVSTLGYSRKMHVWCTTSLDAEHTYEGLIRCFEHLGGVPQEVLLDNQKAAVLAHRAGRPAQFQPRFVDLAQHYGFTPKACQPYRARTKGKDERMVGYVKHNFFARYRQFDSWAHLNQLMEQWLRDEADPRCHGTVKEVVQMRFERERPHLQPLPAMRYDTAYLQHRRVAWDAYIDVRGNRYSVPDTLVGQLVTIRMGLDDSLRVYAGETCVARHHLQARHAGWVTVADHHRQLWQDAVQVERRPLTVYEEVL